MSPPEYPEELAGPRASEPGGGEHSGDDGAPSPTHYGRYVGLLAVVLLVLITVNTFTTKPNGGSGFAPGQQIAPFAVPLALGTLEGDANVATHANEGAAGRRPACEVRLPQAVNICELYERAPVVLALFVNGGSCPDVLGDMQALRGSFPGVQFAAVAIKGEREALRRLVRERGLTYPVGFDRDGVLVSLYKQTSCPQVNFVLPGGTVQSKALLRRVPLATLHARVAELVAAARARGWRGTA